MATEAEKDASGLAHEWLAARILLGLGLIVGIAGFFVSLPLRISQPGATSEEPPAARQFCETAVATATAYGIVPPSTRPSGAPQKTDMRGRYACEASSGDVTYTVSVELLCTELGDQRCFNLFNVTKSDGSVLYQRQQ